MRPLTAREGNVVAFEVEGREGRSLQSHVNRRPSSVERMIEPA